MMGIFFWGDKSERQSLRYIWHLYFAAKSCILYLSCPLDGRRGEI